MRISRLGGFATAALTVTGLLSLSSCGAATDGGIASGPSGPASPVIAASSATSVEETALSTLAPIVSQAAPAASVKILGTVANGIQTPWGIAFLPNGSALVGSRDTARIYLVRPGVHSTLVGRVPGVVSNGSSGGEGGLLGMALSPSFARDHLVYIYYSTRTDNRIIRLTYLNGRLGTPHPVFRGIPHGLHHNGGALVFGPDRMLYVGTGESGNKALAQNKSSYGGKILRMTGSGKVPAKGNPFARSVVYSYGHRNVEGLAFDSQGRLWSTEFGDKSYDELNLILAGHNYGWPATQGRTTNPRYTSPKAQWPTSVAGPSGIAIIKGVAWIGALTGHRLYRVALSGTQASTPKAYFLGTWGRIRRAVAAPDGTLWITTSNTDGRGSPHRGDDRVVRLRVS